jgi:REP-associated tyrosine transposase
MASIISQHYTLFFTATILEWKHLLKPDEYKQIVIDSLLFLKKEGSVIVNAFVIMPNHIHVIWQIQDNYKQDKIQMRFLKFTAQQMKFRLTDTKNKMIDDFLVNDKDRQYQFWERNSLSIDLWTKDVFIQKLIYIHNNSLKHPWCLVTHPEDYKYSSASFYETGVDVFGLVTHYEE